MLCLRTRHTAFAPLRRALAGAHSGRPLVTLHWPPLRHLASTTDSLPRAVQPSIWQSVVPKALRNYKRQEAQLKKPKRKDWNPATFFIIIFLLIGSNAIQMIVLRNDFVNFSRKADVKIGLLKEVIERVQKGEDVDVEGLLGTGNEEKEREWEEGVQALDSFELLLR